MRLVSGAFAGLEIMYNLNNTYDYTLKSIGNNNIVFKINLDNFPENIKNIKEFLEPINRNQTKILKNLIERKKIMRKNKNSIYDNTSFIKSSTENKIKDFYEKFKKESNNPPQKDIININSQFHKRYIEKDLNFLEFTSKHSCNVLNYNTYNNSTDNILNDKLNLKSFNLYTTNSNIFTSGSEKITLGKNENYMKIDKLNSENINFCNNPSYDLSPTDMDKDENKIYNLDYKYKVKTKTEHKHLNDLCPIKSDPNDKKNISIVLKDNIKKDKNVYNNYSKNPIYINYEQFTMFDSKNNPTDLPYISSCTKIDYKDHLSFSYKNSMNKSNINKIYTNKNEDKIYSNKEKKNKIRIIKNFKKIDENNSFNETTSNGKMPYSISSVVKTPIKKCLKTWGNIDENDNKNKDIPNKIKMYKTHYFNIPLVSFLNTQTQK